MQADNIKEIAYNARYYIEELVYALSENPQYYQQEDSYNAITTAKSWLDVGLSEFNM